MADWWSSLIPAGAGLAGIAVGAWLNSHLTTRRERWIFKRDIYVRLLEHLHEAEAIVRVWMRYPQDDRLPELSKEVEEIRRATGVARLFLDNRAATAIEELEQVWEAGRDTGTQRTAASVLRDREAALQHTYETIVVVGRRDLFWSWRNWRPARFASRKRG